MDSVVLFYRRGEQFSGTPNYTDKGKPFTTHVPKCSRCGGAGGHEMWRFTGWTCFRCGGTGKDAVAVDKLYTREQLDKLNASQAKRDANREEKRQARLAEIDAQRNARRAQFLSENAEVLRVAESLNDSFINTMVQQCVERAAISPAQIELIHKKVAENARRAGAQYIGAIGERREFACTLQKFQKWESQKYGFGPTYFHIMRDADGNTIVYKGSKCLGGVRWEGEYSDRYPVVDSTEILRFVATVAEHSNYNGEKQTIVSRPKERS